MNICKTLTLVSILFTSLISCTDKNSKIRGEFLSGCVKSGASKAQCTCIFDQLESTYSSEDLHRINRFGELSENMKIKMIEIAETCK